MSDHTLIQLANAVLAQAPATADAFMGIPLNDIRAALVSADKPFMYGIMRPDGTAYFDEVCVDECDSRTLIDVIEEMGLEDHKVVPLYTRPALEPALGPDNGGGSPAAVGPDIDGAAGGAHFKE